MKNVFVATVALCLSTASAFADQCAYVSIEQAESLASQISIGDTVYKLCEPCGDSTETQSEEAIKVQGISVDYIMPYRGAEVAQAQLTINGNPVDLAYLYLVTGELPNYNMVLTNAAHMVACPTTGVTPSYVAWKHD